MTQLKYDPTQMAQLTQLIHSESSGETFEKITLEKVAIGKRDQDRAWLLLLEKPLSQESTRCC